MFNLNQISIKRMNISTSFISFDFRLAWFCVWAVSHSSHVLNIMLFLISFAFTIINFFLFMVNAIKLNTCFQFLITAERKRRRTRIEAIRFSFFCGKLHFSRSDSHFHPDKLFFSESIVGHRVRAISCFVPLPGKH